MPRSITFEFSGMCCVAPTADKRKLDVPLLASEAMGHDHKPRLMIPTGMVDFHTHADDVAMAPGGATYFIWDISGKEVSLEMKPSPRPRPVRFNGPTATGKKPRHGEECDLRWVPSLSQLKKGHVFDNKYRSLKNNTKVLASVVHLPGGGYFESSEMPDETRVWDFVNPPQHPVDSFAMCDRSVYRMRASTDVWLLIGRQKVPFNGANRLYVGISNLPPMTQEIATGEFMPHFDAYYRLMKPQPGLPGTARKRAPAARAVNGPQPRLAGNIRFGEPVQCGNTQA